MGRLGAIIKDENYYEVYEDLGAVWYTRNGQAKAYVVEKRFTPQEIEEDKWADEVEEDIRRRFREER